MKLRTSFCAAFVIGLIACWPLNAQTVISDQIRLTTPETPWVLTIDGKPFYPEKAQLKADGKGAYFLMRDHTNKMTVSVFIEVADKCKSSEACRDFVLNAGNPAWGKFQDLVKGRIGDFSYFEFYRPEAAGQPLQMLDMYAQYVADGYWVDLHISKALYKKPDHAMFEDLVKSVKFVPKTEQASADAKPIDQARIAVENWLKLWDGGKCKESFGALSTMSRTAIDEKLWVEYCDTGNKSTGKLKARQWIATSLNKSLPGKPGLAGATVRYRSNFENGGPIVEFVSLVQEKTGAWTVANYLVQQ